MIRSILLSMSVATACNAAPHVPPSPEPDGGGAPELAQRIATAKANILADTCFQTEQDDSVCHWGDFPYDPSQFSMTPSTNEAILIVDSFSTLPPRAIRYQNRLKGFFRVGQGERSPPPPFPGTCRRSSTRRSAGSRIRISSPPSPSASSVAPCRTSTVNTPI
ncbi:hypothetical protein ACN28S_55560 [Cystobacter fuscus]